MTKPNYELSLRGFFFEIEEDWKLGRLDDADDIPALIKGMQSRSRRNGMALGRRSRTFHAHIRSFKIMPLRKAAPSEKAQGKTKALPRKSDHTLGRENSSSLSRRLTQKVCYVSRTSHHSGKDDLVAVGGIPGNELLAAAKALAECSFRSNANLLYEVIYELPLDAPVEGWLRTAEILLEDFAAKGCPGLFAVHNPGNPHVHLLVTARPCRKSSIGNWIGEAQGRPGSAGFRMFNGRQTVFAFRRRVAAVINQTCQPAVLFHPGRRTETGLAGEPEARVGIAALETRRAELDDQYRQALTSMITSSPRASSPRHLLPLQTKPATPASGSVKRQTEPNPNRPIPQTSHIPLPGRPAKTISPPERKPARRLQNAKILDADMPEPQQTKPPGAAVPSATAHPTKPKVNRQTDVSMPDNSNIPLHVKRLVIKAIPLLFGPDGILDGGEAVRMRSLSTDEIREMHADAVLFQRELSQDGNPHENSSSASEDVRIFVEMIRRAAAKNLLERQAQGRPPKPDAINSGKRRRPRGFER